MQNEILKVEELLRLAMIEDDIQVLDKLIDESLLFVGPNGNVITKIDDLDCHKNGLQKIVSMEQTDLKINIIDNILAIVTVKTNLKGSFMDKDISGNYRYIRTWRKSQNSWKIIAGAVTKSE